jgi:hypothetical protein
MRALTKIVYSRFGGGQGLDVKDLIPKDQPQFAVIVWDGRFLFARFASAPIVSKACQSKRPR